MTDSSDDNTSRFSRRDLLKASGTGVAGAMLWNLAPYSQLASAATAPAAADQATLQIDATNPGPSIPSTLYGIFFEEINFAGDGGLYGELLRNRGFNENKNKPVHWSLVNTGAAQGKLNLDFNNSLDQAHPRSLRLDINEPALNGRLGVYNTGYWGIPVRPGGAYTARLFVKTSPGFSGSLTLTVESKDGATVYARGTINNLQSQWRPETVQMQVQNTSQPTADTRFVVAVEGGAAGQSIWLGYVSLFPPTYNDRPNGNRVDLMQKLQALQPGIFRFPGGNYLEGSTIDTRFDWKNTVGPPWQRPGHQNTAWGYWSDDGLGLLEYLETAEDLGAPPVLGIWAGYTLDGTVVPRDQLQPYVQNALDEIEYVMGPTSSPWGAQRAADGHPEPFDLKYVEIGNEDRFDNSGSYNDYRYPMFYDAIKAQYPDIQIIATTSVDSRPMDVIDQHFYNNPQFFINNARRYDDAPRNGTKVFVGEYAVNTEGQPPTGTLGGAIGEAAFMTGFERNADKVIMSSYAPLFVRVGHRQWPTNLIGYDALTSYGSPSYYVQQMFSRNTGDVVLPSQGPAQSPVVSSPQANTWYHLVGVYNREAGTLKLFVNGELADTVDYPDSGAWQGTGHTAIGRGLFSGNPVDFVDGRIDDVRLYSRALSDTEAENLPDTGLAGWWKLDTGQGDTAMDSADSHNGSLENEAGWGTGKVGPYALALNGSNQYVETPGPVVNTAQSFTVAAWVNMDATDGFRTFVSIDGDNVSAFYLQKRSNNTFTFTRIPADSTDANSDVVYAATGTTGSDFHYVSSRSQQSGKIYIKAVNAGDTPRQTTIELEGLSQTSFNGTATVLTGSPEAQNSLAQPQNVAPVTQSVQAGDSFNYTFPAHSVTILELDAGS